jgi:hypothetical protein
MPPKLRYTIETIVDAAFQVARRDGMGKLTARTVAAELNASTMPIYSCGKTMAEIEGEVVKRAWAFLQTYQETPKSNDIYLDLGIGYVLFAKDERHLYKCIHSDKYPEINTVLADKNLRRSLERLTDYPLWVGVPEDVKEKILIQGWIYSHGFADLLLNSLSKTIQGLETEAQIIDSFLQANLIYWDGLKSIVEKYRHL